jgi:hypothetical protein
MTKQPATPSPAAPPIGRILSSSAVEFLFGCAGAPGGPLRLGAFVEAETGAACAIGVVADIRVVDDAFARQLVAGDAKPDYIQEQRDRRLTPLEVRALHAGYVLPGGEVRHRLPPRPSSALEAVYSSNAERVRAFLRDARGGWNFSFLSILIAAGATNEVLAECVWQAAAAQPADPQGKFRQEAARELTRLLSVDLQRLYSLLPQLAG